MSRVVGAGDPHFVGATVAVGKGLHLTWRRDLAVLREGAGEGQGLEVEAVVDGVEVDQVECF